MAPVKRKVVLIDYSNEVTNSVAAHAFLDKFLNKQTDIWVVEGSSANFDIGTYALDKKLTLVVIDKVDTAINMCDYVISVIPSEAKPAETTIKAMKANKFIAIGMIPR